MATFHDLPLELLPSILHHLVKPDQLATACLVNKTFYTFAAADLYQIASILPWHKDSKVKVIQLFRTLAACPHLAKHIRRLEIRDFPKSLQLYEYDHLLDACLHGIANATNLRSCTWTRDGSMNSDVLRVLQRCSQLEDLEINGHHDPEILKRFTALRKIRLIMPSPAIVDMLPAWLDALRYDLKNLTIVCKSSALITDALFHALAPRLTRLDQFHAVGCTKLSHEGILAAITPNENGITTLSLEGLSAAFDIEQFSSQCQIYNNPLRSLTSFTITLGPTTLPSAWTPHIVSMLSSSPLEYFQIYCSGGYKLSCLDDDLCTDIVSAHKGRLKRFSVHRIPLSLQAIEDICARCGELEQLFIVIERDSLDNIGSSLSKAKRLRAVHINFTLKVRADELPEITTTQLVSVVEQCSSTVMQIGCNTRVWQVEREFAYEEGREITNLKLGRYDKPDVPEQFRVVQT